jgi:fructosamine-3-kinase
MEQSDTDPTWYRAVEGALGVRPVGHRPLSGGCVAPVYRVDLPRGHSVVAKLDPKSGAGGLVLEGDMLEYLDRKSQLPVPEVFLKTDQVLLMAFVAGESPIDRPAEEQAGRLLAGLHGVMGPDHGRRGYGFDADTRIGGLRQPNPWTRSWIAFFRDHRLLYMAHETFDAGQLSLPLLQRISTLAERLPDMIDEPLHPSLIHGDLWTGNIIVDRGQVTGFVDPAICYADAEIELAFTTLFGTFGEPFFKSYNEIRPISDGFFEGRLDIYNLWYLLVHVRLFGGSYVSSVERVLSRLGV